MEVLTEVQYIKKFFPSRKIPSTLEDTFKRFNEFRNYINMLDMIVDLYNYLRTTTADVERTLIMLEMTKLDEKIKKAETILNWNSENLLEYIKELLLEVESINRRVREAQDNVIKIYKEISNFEDKPLFTRIKIRYV